MRRLTKKRAKENKLYLKQRLEFLGRPENKWCPVFKKGLAGRQSLERTTMVHHFDGREGELLLDESKWIAVSQKGHNWIHANPYLAMKHGLMKKSVPYLYEELKQKEKNGELQ